MSARPHGGGTARQWSELAEESQRDALEWKARALAAEAALRRAVETFRDIGKVAVMTDRPNLANTCAIAAADAEEIFNLAEAGK